MIGVGVIGLGHWGPNYVRALKADPTARLVAAADLAAKRRDRLKAIHPDVAFLSDYRDILARPDIEAVVVATPTVTHRVIVEAALQAGKHVLCEKPLASRSREAWEMVAVAQAGKRVLMCGHIFLFNEGIRYVQNAVRCGEVGAPFYVSSVRTNLGPFRSDVNAAWDLASHDIYILNGILCGRPTQVAAAGGRFLRPDVEDIVFVTLRYSNGALGHIHISWLDPKKVRQITVVGEKKMLTWDEFGQPGPVMVHDRSVVRKEDYSSFGEFQLMAREGNAVCPRIAQQEPLAQQVGAFLVRCRNGDDVSDSRGCPREAAEVVDVLEAVDRSLREEGRFIDVCYGG